MKKHFSVKEVAHFLKYIKYPPDGKARCTTCGKPTLRIADEHDMVSYHVFKCKKHGGEKV